MAIEQQQQPGTSAQPGSSSSSSSSKEPGSSRGPPVPTGAASLQELYLKVLLLLVMEN